MKTRHLAIALAAVAATSVNVMATEHLKSVNPAYIDNTVPAADDFYHHVNNGWLKAHPLTPEYARYGIFNILADSAENQVKRDCSQPRTDQPRTRQQRIQDLDTLFAGHGLRAPQCRRRHPNP